MTINAKIKELKELLALCKNVHHKRQLQADIKSYCAIKNIFDSIDSKKKN